MNSGEDTKKVAELQRRKAAVESYIESAAFKMTAGAEAKKIDEAVSGLNKAILASTNLRTDCAVNSRIKEQLLSARATQSNLMTAFLKMQSANGAKAMRPDLPQGYKASASSSAAPAGASSSDWNKIKELTALLASAQSSLGSLAVVQMTGTLQDTLRGVISDYENTVQRKASLMSQFQSQAASWARESERGSAQNTINVVLSQLAAVDAQMANLRQQPIESLGGAFSSRNIDAQKLLASDVDPRQFLGTWTDPLKYQNTLNLSNSLLRGQLDGSIEGDEDNDEFRQMVASYNDVRLEEAWKKVYAEEAERTLAELAKTVAEENELQGSTVTAANVTTRLQEIVSRANQIGAEIGQGQDAAAKQAAASILQQLQQIVGTGTNLPPVRMATIETQPANPVIKPFGSE